jgi:hypothetical protein
MALVGWMFPGAVFGNGYGLALQPLVRFQHFSPSADGFDDHDRWDFGVNLIFKGHNARMSLVYQRDEGSSGSDQNIFKVGIQFQI